MPIQLACPSCEASIAVSDRSAGRKASCPKCGQRFLVPKPETIAPEDRPEPITFDVKPPEPKIVEIDPGQVPDKIRRKVRNRTPKVRAPLRTQKGIHPGCILVAALLVLMVLIGSIFLVIEWRAAAMPTTSPRNSDSKIEP